MAGNITSRPGEDPQRRFTQAGLKVNACSMTIPRLRSAKSINTISPRCIKSADHCAISDLPFITVGIFSPIMCRSVGATSARRPSSRRRFPRKRSSATISSTG